MPSLIGSMFVSLTAEFGPFQRNMKSAEGIVATTSAGMRRNMGLTEKSVTSLQRTTSSGIRPYALISAARTFDTVQQRANLLRGAIFATTAAFGGLGAALTTNVISRYLDTFTNLENQVRVVSTSSADLAGKMAAIQGVAERSRSSLGAVATLYSRIAKSSPGESSEALLKRVETINKALQLGGATAQESASAAIQFSQAIASNRLGGEELRAVLETPLGMELAKGLGVTIGQFRKMGYEGKLTADVLFKALDKIAGSVDKKFAASVQTIDQALTVADGKITAYAGAMDKAYGITKLVSGSIVGFGNNLETIVPILGSLAALAGANFSARLIAGFGGNVFEKARRGILGVVEARKEDVRLAGDSLRIAERARTVAETRVRSAGAAARGDPMDIAGRAESKAYQRDLAALNKTSRDYTTTLQRQAEAELRLASIPATQPAAQAKALAQLNSLKQREIALTAELGRRRANLDVSRSAASASGSTAAGKGLYDANSALRASDYAAQQAASGLTKATRAAGIAATSFNVLRVGVSSLVGFLGGPWGVAFTAAIGFLAYFGAQSRKAAEDHQHFLDIVRERVGKEAGAGDQAAQVSEIEEQQRRLNEQLEVTRRGYAGIIQNVSSWINFMNEADIAADRITGGGLEKFRDLFREFERGEISLQTLIDRTKNLQSVMNPKMFARLIEALEGMKGDVRDAGIAIKSLEADIKSLDGKKATVTIKVIEDRDQFIIDRNKDEAEQRRQYGVGQDAAREQAERLRRRRELLDAAGDTGNRARNTPAKIAAREQELLEQGYEKTREEARAFATEELNLAEKTRLAGLSANAAAKEYESFANKIAELREQGNAAFLTDTNRKVVDFAKSLKDGSKMMAQYIEAVNSGDLSKAPKQLLEAREAFLKIGAAETWAGILQNYGTAGQLAGQFAEKQAMLNMLVSSGQITAQQAALDWADYIGQFQQYEWVDQLSSAVTNFASAAISDFDNVGDAVKNLLQEILNLIIQLTILDPLKKSLKGFLGSFIGGGASGGAAKVGGSLAQDVFEYHSGTSSAGSGSPNRRVSAAAMSGARRFHGGLQNNELAAVLQKGEAVLNKRQMGGVSKLVGGLSSSMGEGGGRAIGVTVIGARGNAEIEAMVESGVSKGIRQYDKTSNIRFSRDAKASKIRGTV